MYQSEMNTVNGINNEEISLNPIEMEDKALVNDNNVEIPTIILNRNVTKSTNKMESKYACCFCDKIYKKKNSLSAHKYQKHSKEKSSELKKQRDEKKILPAQLKQYGTIKDILDTGISLLVNEIPYYTDIVFISFDKIKSLPILAPGSKVEIFDGKLNLVEFINCSRCHKALTLKDKCCCEPEKSIETFGVLVKKKRTPLPSGWAMKIIIKCGERMVHSVISYESAIYEILSDIEIGLFIAFKFILLNSDNKNDLVRIFYARLFM